MIKNVNAPSVYLVQAPLEPNGSIKTNVVTFTVRVYHFVEGEEVNDLDLTSLVNTRSNIWRFVWEPVSLPAGQYVIEYTMTDSDDITTNGIEILDVVDFALSSEVAALHSDVTGIQSLIETIQVDIENVQTSVNGVDTSIGTLQTSVDAVQTSVSVVQTTLDEADTSIGTLQTSVDGLDTVLSAVAVNVVNCKDGILGNKIMHDSGIVDFYRTDDVVTPFVRYQYSNAEGDPATRDIYRREQI